MRSSSFFLDIKRIASLARIAFYLRHDPRSMFSATKKPGDEPGFVFTTSLLRWR